VSCFSDIRPDMIWSVIPAAESVYSVYVLTVFVSAAGMHLVFISRLQTLYSSLSHSEHSLLPTKNYFFTDT